MHWGDGDTTPSTPRGGDLGRHGQAAGIASGELGDLLGRNNASNVNLKQLKAGQQHVAKNVREHVAMRTYALAHMRTNKISTKFGKNHKNSFEKQKKWNIPSVPFFYAYMPNAQRNHSLRPIHNSQQFFWLGRIEVGLGGRMTPKYQK